MAAQILISGASQQEVIGVLMRRIAYRAVRLRKSMAVGSQFAGANPELELKLGRSCSDGRDSEVWLETR